MPNVPFERFIGLAKIFDAEGVRLTGTDLNADVLFCVVSRQDRSDDVIEQKMRELRVLLYIAGIGFPVLKYSVSN